MRRLCRGPPTFQGGAGLGTYPSALGFLKGTGMVCMPAHAWPWLACWGSLRLATLIVLAPGRAVGCPAVSWELLEDRCAYRPCVLWCSVEGSQAALA